LSKSRKLEFLDAVRLFLWPSGQLIFYVSLGLALSTLIALPAYYKYLALFPGLIAAILSRKVIKLFLHNKYIFEHGAIVYGDYLDVFVKKVSRDDGPDIYGVKYAFEVDGKRYFDETTANVAFGTEFPKVGQYTVIYYLPHNPRLHLAPELIGIRKLNANMDGPVNH